MKSISKYWSIFQITLIISLAYPGEMIGRSLMIIPFMWIFYQLWKVTFSAAGADAGAIRVDKFINSVTATILGEQEPNHDYRANHTSM